MFVFGHRVGGETFSSIEFNEKQVTLEIPSWIKNNAEWWAAGQIDDDSFIQGIQFLIKEGIIQNQIILLYKFHSSKITNVTIT